MVAGKRAETPKPRRSTTKPADKAANDTKPKTTSTAQIARGAGVNLADDQEAALFYQDKALYERMLAKKKAADKDLLDVGKKVQANHGKHGLAAIKMAIKFATDDDAQEDVQKEIAIKLRVMRWMGLPVGAQAGLFDEPDRRPAGETAFDKGKIAGMEGKSMTGFGYDESNANWKEASEGWHAGQAAIFNVRPLDPSAQLVKGEGKGIHIVAQEGTEAVDAGSIGDATVETPEPKGEDENSDDESEDESGAEGSDGSDDDD